MDIADQRNQRDTVNFRHIQIDYCNLTLILLKPRNTIRSAGEADRSVFFTFQNSAHRLANARVIIDYEELDRWCWTAHGL